MDVPLFASSGHSISEGHVAAVALGSPECNKKLQDSVAQRDFVSVKKGQSISLWAKAERCNDTDQVFHDQNAHRWMKNQMILIS